jgi:hypothetical protein
MDARDLELTQSYTGPHQNGSTLTNDPRDTPLADHGYAGSPASSVNLSMHTRRQADDGFSACAGPGGTGLRMVRGGDLRTSLATPSSKMVQGHIELARSGLDDVLFASPAEVDAFAQTQNEFPENHKRCRRMPPPCSRSIPHRY